MRIIAGTFRNRKLTTPKGEATRPTSSRLREALFNICQNSAVDANFLDLFAGSGAMGLEALSRGAKSATFVEQHIPAERAIEQNIKSLDVADRARLLRGDVYRLIPKLHSQGQKWSIIYADPPYSKGVNDDKQPIETDKLLSLLDTYPLLIPGGHLFIEDTAQFPVKEQDGKTLAFEGCRSYGKTQLIHYTSTVKE